MAGITRRRFLKLGAGAMVGGSAGSYLYARHIEPNRLVVEQVSLFVPALPASLQGLTIALMSDFHLYPFTQMTHIEEAIAVTNRQAPDIVMLAGDYVTDRADGIEELMPAFNQLSPPLGTYAVLGNHDYWTDHKVIRAGFANSNPQLLVNEGIALENGLYIAGVDDCWAGRPDLTLALANRPDDTPFTLLLAHEPDFADEFSQDGRVNLQLSGHSHGGQIRLPKMGAVRLPLYGRKYDAGLKRAGKMWVYTSRGIGTVVFPFRVNCPPELTVITLVSE